MLIGTNRITFYPERKICFFRLGLPLSRSPHQVGHRFVSGLFVCLMETRIASPGAIFRGHSPVKNDPQKILTPGVGLGVGQITTEFHLAVLGWQAKQIGDDVEEPVRSGE